MRVVKAVAAALGVLLALAAGLGLPRLALALQDGGLEGRVSLHQVEGVHFDAAAPANTGDKLRLLGGAHEAVRAEGGAVMEAADAYNAALKALEWIAEGGVDLRNSGIFTTHSETPMLAVGQGGAAAVLYWRCELRSADGSETMTLSIDDGTGALLAFDYADQRQKTISTDEADMTAKTAEILGEMFRRCNGFEAYEVTGSEPALGLTEHTTSGARYEMTFTGPEGETVRLGCYISAGRERILFNTPGVLAAAGD